MPSQKKTSLQYPFLLNSFSQNQFFLSLFFSIHTDFVLDFPNNNYRTTLFDFWTVGVLLGLEGWSGVIQDEEKEDLGFIPQPTKKSVHKLPKKGDCDVLHCFSLKSHSQPKVRDQIGFGKCFNEWNQNKKCFVILRKWNFHFPENKLFSLNGLFAWSIQE